MPNLEDFDPTQLPTKYDSIPKNERWRVRQEYARLQDGKCFHCKEPLSGQPSYEAMSYPVDRSIFPDGFFKSPVHLHHSHETGMTIGVVHCRCNAVLWQWFNE